MRFEVVEPFVELRIDLRGSRRPAHRPPREWPTPDGVHDEPHTPTARCISSTAAPPRCSAVNPDQPNERPGEEFARGHYEQLGAASGSIEVGGRALGPRRVSGSATTAGAAILASPVVLPLAHRQRRGGLRVHGFAECPPATGPAHAAASCGMGRPCASAATSSSARPGRATPTTHRKHRGRS